MSDYDEKPRPRGFFHRMKKVILIAVVAIIVLAVALGVGLGLGLKRMHDNGDNGDNNGDNGNGGNTTPPSNGSYPLQNTTALWQPAVGEKWQIILLKPIAISGSNPITPTDAKVWDLDLFDNSADTFKALKKQGAKVVCYFSAGTYENWRPDAKDFPKAALGKPLGEWPGESWIRTNNTAIRKIMQARIKMAADKGCDAIDPDNMDGYSNENGLDLTQADTIDYVGFLASEASKYNMSTGLKNAGEVIKQVLKYVQFSVQEQCIQYQNCNDYRPFIDNGKPVFNIEYPKTAGDGISQSTVDTICKNGKGNVADIKGFSNIIKKMNLDGWTQYCGGAKALTTPIQNTGSKPADAQSGKGGSDDGDSE